MYRLIFQSGPQRGRRVAIRQGPVILGRHPECTIRLSDDGVALQHATLENQSDGSVRLRRLAAEAILRVNQRDVTEATLRTGDVIEIGPYSLEFSSDSAPPSMVFISTKRHLGWLQRLTLTAIGLLLVGQMVFLFVVSLWRQGQPPSTVHVEPVVPVTTNSIKLAQAVTATPEPVKPLPPPPATNASPETNTALTTEIQQMQNEIVQLHHDVANLPKPAPVAAATALPMTNNVLAAEEPDDLIMAQADRMFKKTMAHAAQLDAEALDGELATIQTMAPDFLPSYVERAQILERRSLTNEALTAWRQVQKLAKAADLRGRAAEEIARFEKMAPATNSLSATVPVTPAPPPTPPVSASNSLPTEQTVLRLEQIEQEKMMAGEKYDELRLLRITATARTNTPPPVVTNATVVVTFFDCGKKSGHIATSHAVVPGTALRASPVASSDAPLEFNATYQVPHGFRQQEARRTGETWRYYGYRVELFYGGILQERRDQPAGHLPAP